MLKLLILLAPIAFIDGIGPVRVGALVALLAARRPWGSAIFFLLGTMVSYFLLGIAVSFGIDSAVEFLLADPQPVDYGLGIGIGALLLFLGRRNLKSEKKTPVLEEQPPGSPWKGLLLGVALTIVTAPALLPFFAAIDLILQSGVSDPRMFAALGFYCLVYVLPLIALLGVSWAIGPERRGKLLSRVNLIITNWIPRAVSWLLVVLGVLMIIDGVSFFLGFPLFPA